MEASYYDLHIHSCLSPCGDQDMTPCNIANMAALNGLAVAALTDHNSVKNCPAFLQAAANAGIIGVPGMELTTAEEIHALCLFPDLEQAQRFGDYVYDHLPAIPNRPDIYGEQLICGAADAVLAQESKLLINATDISLSELPELVREYNGVALPAHIDRHSNGVLAILGTLDPDMGFRLAEVSRRAAAEDYRRRFPFLYFISDSDAHDLCAIAEPGEDNLLPGQFSSAAEVIAFLRARGQQPDRSAPDNTA